MSAKSGALRLAVVLSHPTQYYSPWFRWVQKHTALNLRVFYLWDFGVKASRDPQFERTFSWDVDLLSGYEHEFVPNTSRQPGTGRFSGLVNPELTTRLAGWNPDAVLLFGYKWHSHLRAIAWARLHGVPLLFRGDSHLLGRGPLPIVTRTMLHAVYAQFSALLPVGAANRTYFRHLGVPESRLFFAPHSVDDARFDPADPGHERRAKALRADLGISPATRVVLFAGKLISKKRPRALLHAFLAQPANDSALVFVGDGPEREHLVRDAARSPRVHFLPFANQSEIPAHYLVADVFALPSQGHAETWGLAINEAMHMGVPCLVSDVVGCQADLVEDGVTGWVFPAGQPDALRAALVRALHDISDAGRRAALRERVRERIGGYTYASTTAGLLAALDSLPLRSS